MVIIDEEVDLLYNDKGKCTEKNQKGEITLMKKKALAVLMAAAMVASMTACGGSSDKAADSSAATEDKADSSAAAGDGEAVELVVGGVTSSSAKDAVTYFGEKVNEYSNGTITIADFPDNQLGNDEQRFEMAQNGECDISIGSTSSVSASYHDLYLYDVYYMFLSKQEVYDVGFGGEAGQKILEGFDQFGLKGLAMWENGFRNVTTNNTPVNTVADLKGLKLRTMENSIHLAAWKAMGANPTPMAFSELYTAMQQGTVDGEENPLGIITGNGFEEVEKYCTLTEHVYTPYYVVMNADKYNSLSADQQAAIEKAMAEATTYQYEQSNKYEEESIDTMEAAGCTVTTLDEAAKLEFKAAADSGDGLSLAKEQMDNPDLADKMVEELEAYRK